MLQFEAQLASKRTPRASAAKSASSATASALAALLSRLFACSSPDESIDFLSSSSVSRSQRKQLGVLAGVERAWLECDQAVPANVRDLAEMLVVELYAPFWFYRSSLSQSDPRGLFAQLQATRPLHKSKSNGFWSVTSGTSTHSWLPDPRQSFDAVVHFVQAASGTGVHVGAGLVLTCAHVVDAQDDAAEGSDGAPALPTRTGRRKVVMFPSGRTFVAECAASAETADGTQDAAVLALGSEVMVQALPATQSGAGSDSGGAGKSKRKRGGGGKQGGAQPPPPSPPSLPVARIGERSVAEGERLFCVGNPSSIDLETLSGAGGEIEFEPPTWHASAGSCLGYLSPDAQQAQLEQAARGRTPTRGEKKRAHEAPAAGAEEGGYLQHSCWTYWGHSGAPLFGEDGAVLGLHCAWDDRSGMRHGQKVQHLHDAIRAALL